MVSYHLARRRFPRDTAMTSLPFRFGAKDYTWFMNDSGRPCESARLHDRSLGPRGLRGN
jgi:hypothetical protein